MADIQINCPLCSDAITVETEWAGMEIQCPLCQGRIILPQFQAQTVPPQQSHATPPRYGTQPQYNTPLRQAQMADIQIKCPLCSGAITVRTEWAGMEIQCPLCQGRLRLPQFQQSPAVAPSAPPSQMPLNQESCGVESKEWEEVEYEEESDDDEETALQSLANIAFTVSWPLYLVAIIVMFLASAEWGWGLFALALILSLFGWIFKRRVKFSLYPDERIIFTCRLRDDDDIVYFTRVTNQRVVLCAIEYPLVSFMFASLLEHFARPSSVSYEWYIKDIRSVEVQQSFLDKKMYIITPEETLKCCYNDRFMSWWNPNYKDDPKLSRGATVRKFIIATILIIIIVVMYGLVYSTRC